MVDSAVFLRLQAELQDVILASIDVVLRQHGLVFSAEDMARQGTASIEHLALEALTLGADCWPRQVVFALEVANAA